MLVTKSVSFKSGLYFAFVNVQMSKKVMSRTRWYVSILELSSYLLEIPNDGYTTLSQSLIGYATLSQDYCGLIG